MAISQWEINIALGALGLTDDQKATVTAAMPIASKLIGHIEDNKQLFSTLWADIQLVLPAAQILLDALKTNTLSVKLTKTTSDNLS